MNNSSPRHPDEPPHASCPFLKLMTILRRSITEMCRNAAGRLK